MLRPRLGAPNPGVHLGSGTQKGSILAVQLDLPVRPPDVQELAVGAVAERQGVVAELHLLPELRPGQLVEGDRAVEAAHREHVIGLVPAWVPAKAPHLRALFDENLLHPGFISDADVAVVVPEGEVLAVVRPRQAQDLGVHLLLRHGLLLRGPQPKVARGSRSKLLGHWVVRQRLDRVVVGILEDSLSLARPDDHVLVRAAASETLAVVRIRYAVHRVLVALEGVEEVTVHGIVDKNPGSHPGHELRALRIECQVVTNVADVIALRYAVGPGKRCSHVG